MTASRQPSGCAPAYETEYEADSDQSLAVTISEALATVEGTEPWEIDPLYDVIDFDAVERLFQGDGETQRAMTLTFGVGEWNVHVHGDGTIEVFEAVRPADPSPTVESVVGD
ncbi:HalOD1 output domain-containing protein [Halomicrobium salinisoli]|uniref:HalOD1 output domain-containing protein n=1 Tax=Halomicrobium salinisoli TaxID=2878391 RepID=UPI001CF06DBA|nr:HalOD1 output domain-containing protein [Halomicrobium salinisoli]